MKTQQTLLKSLCSEWLRVMTDYGMLSGAILAAQNTAYANTGAVSQNNRQNGFVPGFQDLSTGKTEISRFANGEPAPIHMLDGLPEDWVASRDDDGHVASTKNGIIAGFIRSGKFFTREDVLQIMAEENPEQTGLS